MDAGEPGVRSIRRELVGWLSAGLVAAVIIGAVATYFRAREEANDLFDYQLSQMASSITGMPLAARSAPGSAPGGDALIVEIWNRDGVEIYLSQPQRRLPHSADLGFRNVRDASGEWRVLTTIAGDQIVQVAQPMAARRELAASMALRTIVPLLAIIPFLAALVWFGIASGLRPLARIAEAVGRRSPRTLEPLPESGLPLEVKPLVQALNQLLGRLATALDAQRSFIADAAHELRRGLDRATRLVGQLLTLAREEPGMIDRPFAPVDLVALAREVIAEGIAQASQRRIDLGLSSGAGTGEVPPATIRGDAVSLRTLLGNLIDNALRYTPEGGRVDVTIAAEGNATTLSVRDSGPGIPAAEQGRVFDRFYRAPGTADTPGSGLGLAIVKSIAERHAASITLGTGIPGDAGPGLTVTVRFPS